MAVNNMRNLQMYCVSMELSINISLLKKLTGWTPAHDLEAGLTKTYKIMKSYYKN